MEGTKLPARMEHRLNGYARRKEIKAVDIDSKRLQAFIKRKNSLRLESGGSARRTESDPDDG